MAASRKGWLRYFVILGGGLVLLTYGWFLYANPRIVIEWQTATEINTIGFNLYRAEDAQGPYLKINETLIPSSNDPLKGGSYQYVDARVVPNRVYIYKLEDLDTQGKTTLHDPISVAVKPQGLLEMVAGGGMALFGLGVAILRKLRWKSIDEGKNGSR
ncbi:MAG: hypothetical protein ACK44E_03045 [Anaerolineales bacterium]